MIKVYLANRPPLEEYLSVDVISQLSLGEIKRIGNETGNHWRKIFNVYAKLIYCVAEKTNSALLASYASWQEYRDKALLQLGSDTELHLQSKNFVMPAADSIEEIHIVMGKAYSQDLLKDVTIEWLDNDFAINRLQGIIVCPYFDYRQLSNVKIESLAELILSLTR